MTTIPDLPAAIVVVPPDPIVSPHVRPAVASAVGVAVGVLTLAQGYFGAGHLPSSAEVASIVAGSGLTGASVLAFIAHHASWLKAVGPVVAAEIPALEQAAARIPGLDAHLASLQSEMLTTIQTEVSKLVPDVDVDALAEAVKTKILVAAAGVATVVPIVAVPVPPVA